MTDVKLDADRIESFIREFYAKADASAPLVWYLPYIDESFHMGWTPTCQFDGPEGFEEFYRCLTGNLFDRVHEVHDIKIDIDGDEARISFTIHLTAKVWQAPLPRSIHAENEANFEWVMKASPTTGNAVITSYVLTGVKFPEGSIIVDADKVFQYPQFLYGPWGFP